MLLADLATHPKLRVYFVYYNPAQIAAFDARPSLRRFYAAKLDVRTRRDRVLTVRQHRRERGRLPERRRAWRRPRRLRRTRA